MPYLLVPETLRGAADAADAYHAIAPWEAPGYLVERSLFDPSALVTGDLVVEDSSRRNINYKVIDRVTGVGYLLKQAAGLETLATLRHEAAIYRVLAASDTKGFDTYLPRFYGFDEDRGVLVLELVPDSRDLLEHHNRTGRFPIAAASALGTALASLHLSYPSQEVEAAISGLDPRSFGHAPSSPGVLTIHRPRLSDFEQLSASNLRLVEVLQRFPRYGDLLDDLRSGWRPLCLTHSDLKWTNVLALRLRGRMVAVRIVDWELACVGDPCWDVGSVFAEYLNFWLLSVPATGDAPPASLLEYARYPLRRVQRAVRAFWASYREGVAHSRLSTTVSNEASDIDKGLLLAVRYCAARLVQTAYEAGQASATLTAQMVLLLQVGMNMLQNPSGAALQLLGIDSARVP